MKTPQYIMIHHTAVSTKKNPDQFKATNNYHRLKWNSKSTLGFYIGYHYEINAQGLIRQARQDGETAVACWQQKMNDGRCVHVCLDGNFDTDPLAHEQGLALHDLLRKLCVQHKIAKDNIVFHNQFAKKTCPGKNLTKDSILSLLQAGDFEPKTLKGNG